MNDQLHKNTLQQQHLVTMEANYTKLQETYERESVEVAGQVSSLQQQIRTLTANYSSADTHNSQYIAQLQSERQQQANELKAQTQELNQHLQRQNTWKMQENNAEMLREKRQMRKKGA